MRDFNTPHLSWVAARTRKASSGGNKNKPGMKREQTEALNLNPTAKKVLTPEEVSAMNQELKGQNNVPSI